MVHEVGTLVFPFLPLLAILRWLYQNHGNVWPILFSIGIYQSPHHSSGTNSLVPSHLPKKGIVIHPYSPVCVLLGSFCHHFLLEYCRKTTDSPPTSMQDISLPISEYGIEQINLFFSLESFLSFVGTMTIWLF